MHLELNSHLTATTAKAASWGERVLIPAASLLPATFAEAARSSRTARPKPIRS